MTGPEQALDMQGEFSNICPILAAKGVVSRAPESRCGSSGAPSCMSRLTHFSPAPELLHAAP